jgi:hypothetical protein
MTILFSNNLFLRLTLPIKNRERFFVDDGALFDFLSAKGIQLFPIVSANDLVDYTIKDDLQFIKGASSLILGGSIEDDEALKLINDLKRSKTDRKKIIEGLLEKSRRFLDCAIEKIENSSRKGVIQEN